MQRKHLWLRKLLECKISILESNQGLYLHLISRCLYFFPYTCSQSVLETGQWVFYLQQYLRFLSLCFHSASWNHKSFIASKIFLSSNLILELLWLHIIAENKPACSNGDLHCKICIWNKKPQSVLKQKGAAARCTPGNPGNCHFLKVTSKN